ncbi:MAG: motility associated factor glycosyltransferase family protein [Ignavibacteriales bacterium]
MMELYDKNKTISDLGLKCVLAITKEQEEINPHKFIIENFPAKNGSLTCKIGEEREDPILIHSSYNPEKEAESVVSDLDFSKHGLFIVFGMGMLYHVEKIMEKASAKSRIAVVEPSLSIYNNAMKNKDMKKIFQDPRVILIIGIHSSLVPVVLESADRPKSLMLNMGHNIQFIEMNYYKRFFADTATIMAELRNIAQVKWKMLGNCHVDHNIGLVQAVLNLDYILDSIGIKETKDIYKEKAVILVAAGPSLDKNIEELKKAKGKMLIFAVDAVIEKLIKNGITPDMVVTVERLGVYENLFEDKNYEIAKEIVLGAPTLSEVKTFELFKDNPRLVFFPEGVGTQEYFEKVSGKGVLATGTSAFYVALNMAVYMGCSKIAFAGLDLAYGLDGKMYCEGISKKGGQTEAERMEDEFYLDIVKDYEGNDMRTNFLWKDQLIILENNIRLKPNIQFFDATEGGAKKEGATKIRLKEFIEKYSDSEHKQLINIIKEQNIKAKKIDKKEVYKKIVDEVEKDYQRFDEISDKIKKHFEKLKKKKSLFIKNNKNVSKKEIDESIKLIEGSQHLVERIEKERFLCLYYQGLIAGFKKEVNQIGKMELIESIRKHIDVHYEYFGLINGVFKYNLDHFDYIKEHLKKKINNEPVEKDIIKILSIMLKKNNINPNLAKEYFGKHDLLDETFDVQQGETN